MTALAPGDLKSALLSLFRSPEYRPPLLPAVALELLAVSQQPRVTAAQIGELLGHDPLLAGQVLRLAGSAAYARGEPVRTLDQAILRLGLARVTDLFFQACMELKVFRAPGFESEMEALRAHSVLTAEAARIVCRHSVGFEEHAFLCGLLHDVGTAACILALSDSAARGRELDLPTALSCVEEIHESCSQMVAKIWKLPSDIELALSLHHRLVLDGHFHPIAAAVALADGLAAELGFGFHAETDLLQTESAARFIGIDAGSLDRIREAVALIASGLSAASSAPYS